MTRIRQHLRAGIALAALTASCAALAAQPAKEGRFDYFHCMTGKWNNIHSSEAVEAGYVHENFASTVSNIPGSLFDGLGAHCAPIFLRLGAKIQVDGYCRYTDRDGDSWIMRFVDRISPESARGTFEMLAGTGKFDGATIRGEIAPGNGLPSAAQPGVLNRCTRVTGSYRLR